MVAPAPTMKAPKSGVTVRMYRQGLGDCFLLAFPPDRGSRPRFMLIDCGVLLGTSEGKDKVRQVAGHILESTGGEVDVLVATHEHWDHLSGFEQARDLFDRLKIGEVWVAWTEDLEDPVSRSLRRERRAALRALTATASHLRASAGKESIRKAESLDAVLGFFGDLSEGLGVDGKPAGIEAAMDYVVGRGKPPRFRTPGEGPLRIPGTAGARVYVLGPPKDLDFLKRSDPRKGEAYEARLALDEKTAFVAAVLHAQDKTGERPMSSEEKEIARLAFPFDKVFRVTPEGAKQDPFFQEFYYGFPGQGTSAQPSEEDLEWRRIDADWMGSAGSLALKLDSDTNNTSLALAIELVPSGKVLLFPGDAQAGNWTSWHKLKWPREDDPSGPSEPVTAADLMRRTVLYKVGHHASHNATLREKGLEMMEHPDLVALIPVDENMAHKPKGGSPKGWDMPFPPLLERLKEKTGGRILRVDHGLPKRPSKVSAAEWKQFTRRCVEDGLYLDYTVEG